MVIAVKNNNENSSYVPKGSVLTAEVVNNDLKFTNLKEATVQGLLLRDNDPQIS